MDGTHLAAGLENGLLILLGHAVKEGLVHEDGRGHMDMSGAGHILLHFVELLGHDVGGRVLLAVNGLQLQRGIEFAEGDNRGNRAEGLEGINKNFALGNADLETLHVRGGFDLKLVVGQMAHAVFPPADDDGAMGLNHFRELFADGAVHDFAEVIHAAENKGQVEDAHVRDPVGKDGVRSLAHVHAAGHDAFSDFELLAKLVGGVDSDFDVAAGELVHAFGEHGRDGLVMMIGGARVPEFQLVRGFGV